MKDNIAERRAYIKKLLDEGKQISNSDIRTMAHMFNSSYPAMINDLAVCQGLPRPYTKPQSSAQNIRARKLGLVGEITEEEWKKVLRENNYSCVRCGSKNDIAIDHIIPISKGGSNTVENIQPLCRSCNSKKGDRL